VEVKVLLDTNRLSDALAEDDDVLDCLEAAEEIRVPVIVLGELRAGFMGGKRAAQNEERLQWFLAQDGVAALSVDGPVSHRYAEIHRVLRRAGAPIPTNDLWIAALAIEHGLALYSRDVHFAHVPGLARI
jgi:tRNA(fMet)-specific endonuclease VapC